MNEEKIVLPVVVKKNKNSFMVYFPEEVEKPKQEQPQKEIQPQQKVVIKKKGKVGRPKIARLPDINFSLRIRATLYTAFVAKADYERKSQNQVLNDLIEKYIKGII